MQDQMTSYVYQREDGATAYIVWRYRPKAFAVEQDGQTVAYPKVPVLYRLPELLASTPDQLVYIVEGEKDVETLRAQGLTATTNPCGAVGGWRPEFTQYLRGRHVVIVPDNDKAGRGLGLSIAAALKGVAASVVIVHLPVPRRGDVTDWIERGGTLLQLRKRVSRARDEQSRTAAAPAAAAATVSARPSRRRQMIYATRLAPLEKLLLLAMLDHSDPGQHGCHVCRVPVAVLSRLTGVHRVTAHRLLDRLQTVGAVTCDGGRRLLHWDVIEALGGWKPDTVATPDLRCEL